MLLFKKNLRVSDIKYGEGLAEVFKIGVENIHGKIRHYTVTYVPPKTNAWTNEEYKNMVYDT